MALNLSPDQIQGLYSSGKIGDDTFAQLMGQQPQQQVAVPMALPQQPQQVSDPMALPDQGNGLSNLTPVQAQNLFNNGQMSPDAYSRLLSTHMGQMLGKPAQNSITPSQQAVVPPSDNAGNSSLSSIQPQEQAPNALHLASSPTDAGYDQQINAVKAGAIASAGKTNAQSKDIGQYLAESQNNEMDRQKNELDRQAEQQNALDDLQKTSDQVAAMKVDPNNLWNKADTGSKIMMGIGLALGAVGASSTGDNKAVGVLNQAIDRDIAAQKANIGNAQSGLNSKQNLYGLMRQKYGDERAAESATKIALLDRTKMQIEQKALQYSSPEVKAAADKTIGGLMVEKAKEQQKFLAAQSSTSSGIPSGLTPSEKLAYQKDKGERTTPLGMVSDARLAPLVREKKALFDEMSSIIKEQAEIAKKYSGPTGLAYGLFSLKDSARSKALSANLDNKLNKAAENGVMNPGDLKNIRQQNPGDVTTTIGAEDKLKTLEGMMRDEYKSKIMSYGLHDPLADKPLF